MKKKKLVQLYSAALIVSMIVGSSYHVTEAAPKMPTSEEWIDNYKANDYIGITNKEMREDFEYLWKTLNENYPYFGVAKRMGIDSNHIYNTYRKKIEVCENDFEFYRLIKGFVDEFKGLGHINLFSPNSIDYYVQTYYEASMESDEMNEHYKPWLYELNKPLTIKNYALFNRMMNPPEILAIFTIEYNNKVIINQPEENGDSSWIETKILDDGKTAYMKIDTFRAELVEKSRPIIMDFYKKAKNCENLIIDITDNGGGAYDFWQELLAAPNVDKDMVSTSYDLVMMGENNKKYIDGNVIPIDKLPEFENIDKEDLELFDGFMKDLTVISPAQKEKAFGGKIWLLVGPSVYSASENFAVFCKNTGFATIVGQPTGGDGIGSDPAFISLPNTGLLVLYSFDYGINSDGSGNEEFGTMPDILSPEGETALETCLKAIKESK